MLICPFSKYNKRRLLSTARNRLRYKNTMYTRASKASIPFYLIHNLMDACKQIWKRFSGTLCNNVAAAIVYRFTNTPKPMDVLFTSTLIYSPVLPTSTNGALKMLYKLN